MNEFEIDGGFSEETGAEGESVVTLEAERSGERCDVYAAEKLGITRSAAQKLLTGGSITVNGTAAAKNTKLRLGDVIEVILPPPEAYEVAAEDIPLDVVYEDDHIIVINKPCGMVVHPAPGHTSGTLVNGLMHHCGHSLSGINGVLRPGIVHRIDRDTSGLICVAKNDGAHIGLSAQLKDHTMHREYRAIVTGGFSDDCGTVNAPIGRHPVDRKRMAVVRTPGRTARAAVTHYKVLERYRGFSLVEAVLETGRTHQIRVHLSHIGHPLVGDVLYGGGHTPFEKHNAPLLHGQCLHAAALILVHPVTGETMRFEAPLPEDFAALLEKLRNL